MKRRDFIAVSAISGLVPTLKLPNINDDQKGFVVRKGKARNDKHLPFRGININDLKVSKADTKGNFSLFEYIGVEKTGPSFHVHLEQDEHFFVIEGEYKFRLGEEYFKLTAGDSIFLPRNIPHTWIQLSDRGRLIYMVSPAGTFEEFFQEMLEIKSPPTKEFIDEMHAKHNMKIVGPPLELK
jgi:quercetin 2,3-dioxygenase